MTSHELVLLFSSLPRTTTAVVRMLESLAEADCAARDLASSSSLHINDQEAVYLE
jgi:hypothetical protein